MATLKRDDIAYFKVAVFILLNIIFFSKGFLIFYNKWFWTGSYYTHGPLVVIAFIWLLYKRQKDYKPVFKHDSFDLSGCIIIIISILVYLLGSWKNIPSFTTWGIFFYVFGNCVLFFSKHFVIKNIGIFIYLTLAVPIPEVIIDRLTFELNLFASYSSELFISLIYPSTIRNGNILQVNGHSISITYECSGLSNLLSMFSLVWLMALVQSRKIIAVTDYLISVPAAIISNFLRIVIITIFVVNGYERFALYDWHYEIGIAVFIVIVIMIALFNDFSFKKDGFSFKTQYARVLSFILKNNKSINVYIVFMILLCFTGFIIPNKNKPIISNNEILLKNKIPDSIGGWQSKGDIAVEDYYNVLGTNDLLMRAYREKGNSTKNDDVYLYIIRSKDNVSAFHRPELCLRGEGYELLTDNVIDLSINIKKIPVRRMLFVEGDKGLLVYYWYYINGRNIKDTLHYQLLFLFNLNEGTNGNFIRISKPVNLNNITREEEKMKRFAKEAIPEILAYL